MDCHCGSMLNAAQCCQAIISGTQVASSPEALMRSRYTAFVTKNSAYLVASLHPSKRRSSIAAEIEVGFEKTFWKSLKVVSSQEQGNKGLVEFFAFFASSSEPTKIRQLHESSNFVKEKDSWYYLDANFCRESDLKLGRNDGCWCGSGKKYKKCCYALNI